LIQKLALPEVTSNYRDTGMLTRPDFLRPRPEVRGQDQDQRAQGRGRGQRFEAKAKNEAKYHLQKTITNNMHLYCLNIRSQFRHRQSFCHHHDPVFNFKLAKHECHSA